ncbi:MAG: YcxB family protein [Dysgonamonadaceae bacterium]
MISTKRIQLTEKDIFMLLMQSKFMPKLWIYLLFIVLILISFSILRDLVNLVLLILVIASPLISIFQLYSVSRSRSNAFLKNGKCYEIDSDKIVIKFDDGTDRVLYKSRFKKKHETKDHYLLYLSDQSFLNIPKSSFVKIEDEDYFLNAFYSKIGLQ